MIHAKEARRADGARLLLLLKILASSLESLQQLTRRGMQMALATATTAACERKLSRQLIWRRNRLLPLPKLLLPPQLRTLAARGEQSARVGDITKV